MSTLLIMRANRVLLLSMATILVASMLAPMAAVANTDLVIGDTAIVSNPDGSGAYLRSDITVLDDTTITAEIPQGTTVYVQDGPFSTDTGSWVWVASDGYGPGYVSTTLLQKIGSEEFAEANGAVEEEPVVEEEEVVSEVAWLEPIDTLVVVDYNGELSGDGLAVRTTASVDGPVIGYAPVGTWLDVTAPREWAGDLSFVQVNFQGVGGYVDGRYVELSSEATTEEPEEEVIWTDDPETEEVPTEEVPVETEEVATEEVPVETEEVATEEVPVETEEVATEEVPVETEEVATEEVPVETEEVATEEVPVETEEVATEEVPVETEEVATEEVPVETEEVATEEVPVETEEVATEEVPVETEEVATEEVVATPTEEATEEIPAETEEVVATPTEEATEEVPVETEEVVATPTEEATEEAPAETEEVASTPEVAPTEEATEAATEPAETEATAEPTTTKEAQATAAPTKAAKADVTAEPTATKETKAVTPAPIASTAKSFNKDAMIGSATVTGTTNGLLCRAEPNPAAPVLMTLAEGTKVLVSAEPTNGYLGIDCGGLQGFADVNYLWSGGAGDEEITSSKMNVMVTGTGNGLNCRTGAGLNHSVITVIFDGTSLVTRGPASNGWTPVTCGGKNGFVSTTWIEAKSGSSGSNSGSTASSGSATVSADGDGLYCRSGAGTSYGIITVLRDGSSVAVRGAKQGDWIPVTCGGTAGFAHASYLKVGGGGSSNSGSGSGKATGTITVANTGGQALNCRTGAGTNHSVITTLSLGQSVQTRSGSVNGWTAVICGGTNGFVSSEFVSGGGGSNPTNPKPNNPQSLAKGDHAKATDAVNLRYSASTSASVSTVIDSGVVILVTGSLSNNFYPVNYDGLTGYVHKDYLAKTSSGLSKRGGSGTPTEPPPSNPGGNSPTGNAMVNYAMRYVGYPYVWATHGPASFDCSGFTYWVTLNVTGKNIGTGTWTQVSAGTPVSKSNLKAGDLVFFQNTYTAGLSHVGIYIGNGQFIHAQNEETGVVVSDLNSSYYGPRWYGAVRV